MHTIRKATSGDSDNIASLHQELADLHVQGAQWNFVHKSPSYTRELFEERLKDNNTFFFVAENDNEILAYAIFQIQHSEDFPILKKRSWLFIKDIIVTESHKGKGIGSLLLEKGEEFAKEMSLGSIELGVWSFNEKATNFYKKRGFEEYYIKMRKTI